MAQDSIILVRNLWIPLIVIIIVNFISYFNVVPVFIQLLLNSCCCVYIGCIKACELKNNPKGVIVMHDNNEEEEVIDMKKAQKFPIIASGFLLGCYLIYKYVSKQIFNILISSFFYLTTVIDLSNSLIEVIKFPSHLKNTILHVKVPKIINQMIGLKDFDISPAGIIVFIGCSIPVALFCITKFWMLNNVFGIYFAIFAIKSINLSTFKVGFVLLWLLFFYDIFWVYGTDVMVTVAKNLDIPIKLLFPFINDQGQSKFSMLGLGDIVIPGFMVCLCLKFDLDRCILKQKVKKITQFNFPYFNLACIGYFFGIVITFLVLYLSNHAQPALLFLVPCCTIPLILLSIIRKQLDYALEYTAVKQKKENLEDKVQNKQDSNKAK